MDPRILEHLKKIIVDLTWTYQDPYYIGMKGKRIVYLVEYHQLPIAGELHYYLIGLPTFKRSFV